MKTVLVPGAPWPPKDAKVNGKKTKEQADINFESWVQKQKEQIDFERILGKAIK